MGGIRINILIEIFIKIINFLNKNGFLNSNALQAINYALFFVYYQKKKKKKR